jgi:adenylosuccinate synthase
VDVYVGGQFGSEGKGHIVSYVAREYQVLLRVGGPNAGHKVYMDDGAVTHHQLPSGTLRADAKLLIGAGAVLNIESLLEEIAQCRVSADRLAIDPRAMIITRADIAGESALRRKIGSTKQGVGFATARKITERGGNVKLAGDYRELHPYVKDVWEELEKAYSAGKKVLLEGTQGTGLSIHHGDYPVRDFTGHNSRRMPVGSWHLPEQSSKGRHGLPHVPHPCFKTRLTEPPAQCLAK